MVAIVDYGLGNLGSIANMLKVIGEKSVITADKEKIAQDIQNIMDADRLRKELTIQNTELAYKMIDPLDKVILIYSPSFYEGVLGIIAQKVMKKTGKITGVFNFSLAAWEFYGLNH